MKIPWNAICTAAEYKMILDMVDSGHTMLVFGVGNDTQMWEAVCDHVVYVEDVQEWEDRIRLQVPTADVRHYDYPTTVQQWLDGERHFPTMKLDRDLHRTYDFIFVDGPRGDAPTHPGRMLPIFFAWCYGYNIFVHDFNRTVEQEVCRNLMGEPTAMVQRMAYYENDPSILSE